MGSRGLPIVGVIILNFGPLLLDLGLNNVVFDRELRPSPGALLVRRTKEQSGLADRGVKNSHFLSLLPLFAILSAITRAFWARGRAAREGVPGLP